MMPIKILLAVALATPVYLFSHPGGHGPCSHEIEKHCPEIKPGEGKLFRCLNRHKKNLSYRCKSHVKRMKLLSGDRGVSGDESSPNDAKVESSN